MSGRYNEMPWGIYLRYKNQWSPFGILCDLHCIEHERKWKGDFYLGRIATLPKQVQRWAEVDSESPHINGVSIHNLSLMPGSLLKTAEALS